MNVEFCNFSSSYLVYLVAYSRWALHSHWRDQQCNSGPSVYQRGAISSSLDCHPEIAMIWSSLYSAWFAHPGGWEGLDRGFPSRDGDIPVLAPGVVGHWTAVRTQQDTAYQLIVSQRDVIGNCQYLILEQSMIKYTVNIHSTTLASYLHGI